MMKFIQLNDTDIMNRLMTLLLFLFCCNAYAQDLITRKDGREIQATILEVSKNDIKYRLYDDPDGVIYIIPSQDVHSVVYGSLGLETYVVKEIPANLKYKELKRIYNYRDYDKDVYGRTPRGLGFASFFVPGLGECINNEWGRGLGKFFPCFALNIAGAYFLYYEELYEVSLACYAASILVNIWSVVDAVRITKGKNLYKADLHNNYSLNLYPSVDYIGLGDNLQPTAGFTLAMRF